MDAYLSECDWYCSDCAPKGADGPHGDGGGEADCPQHCAECHCALGNPLTTYGVKYVLDALEEYIREDGGAADVLDEWSDQLADYPQADHVVRVAYCRIRELERKAE